MSHLPTSSFHLPIHFIRHINESESVEHSINISHASDVAQSFRPVHHRSHLFYIVQCQQYRTPCQAFTILPAVDPKLFCVLPINLWTKANKPTAGRIKAIHRRLELSFNLYLLFLLWVKTELSQKPPTYNPGFSASCSFSTNKTFEGQLKPSKPFSYRRFSWLTLLYL